MPLTRRPDLRMRPLGSESGFTLVESLVAMAAGIVVFAALFTILDVAMSQTTRVISRADATQRSRVALSEIETELHSSCVGNDVTPIQSTSDSNNLVFVMGTGGATTVTPVQHTITFTPNGARGTLTDTSATGTTTLLGNAAQTTDTAGNPIPVFQYFRYEKPTDGSGFPYRDPAGQPYQMLIDGVTPLPNGAMASNGAPAGGTIPPAQPIAIGAGTLGSQAAATNEVLISFVAYPEGTDTSDNLSDIGVPVKDGVVLRLTPIANHDSGQINVDPCA
jgi:type II secretory pathway component PulJ